MKKLENMQKLDELRKAKDYPQPKGFRPFLHARNLFVICFCQPWCISPYLRYTKNGRAYWETESDRMREMRYIYNGDREMTGWLNKEESSWRK